MYNVVDMNTLLTSPEDFIYDIEPSELGSKKVANAIYYVSQHNLNIDRYKISNYIPEYICHYNYY